MTRWWHGWVARTSRQERGTTLALFRIGVGLVVLYSLLSIAGAGLVDALWVDAEHGGSRALQPTGLVAWLGGATPDVIWSLWWISLIAAIAMVLGIGGRVPLVAVGIAYQPMATINGDAYGGYEMMIGNATWLLVLGECNATLSLDCRRRTGKFTSDALVAAWPRTIALFQLLVIYSASGMQKLSADWVPGGSHSAVYWILQDPTWNNFDLRLAAAKYYPITQVATVTSWFFEVTAVGMLLVLHFRDTAERPGRLRALVNRWDLRVPWMLAGLGLHLGILIALNVGPFSWISFCFYLCLWKPAELERFATRLQRRGRS